MKRNIQKKAIAIVLSLLIIFSFTLTSCKKEQQLGITLVNGGSEGTFGRDLDGDKDIDGSYFGMNVAIYRNHSAKGHFRCSMIGKWDILNLPEMTVMGPVNEGSIEADGSAIFQGVGSVNLGNGVIYEGVPFVVRVTSGGPGVGTLTLTVIGAFDGTAGDTNVGNGNYDLPPETVFKGQISISEILI